MEDPFYFSDIKEEDSKSADSKATEKRLEDEKKEKNAWVTAVYADECHKAYFSPKGFTPLFYAAQRGHVEIVRLLLEAKADPLVFGYSLYPSRSPQLDWINPNAGSGSF